MRTIRDLMAREPFQPFRIVTSSGKAYVVKNPDLVVLMKSQAFIAEPDSDHSNYVSYLHISAVETMNGNGHRPGARRRKSR